MAKERRDNNGDVVGDREGRNKDGDGCDTSCDGDSAPQGSWDGCMGLGPLPRDECGAQAVVATMVGEII